MPHLKIHPQVYIVCLHLSGRISVQWWIVNGVKVFDWWTVTEILKECNSFIFQVKQSMGIRELHSFERFVPIYQSAGSKSPEGMSLHQSHCGNLKCCNEVHSVLKCCHFSSTATFIARWAMWLHCAKYVPFICPQSELQERSVSTFMYFGILCYKD